VVASERSGSGRLGPWLLAAREAVLVALTGLALGGVISFLFLIGGGIPRLGVANAVRGGIVLFLMFHHVGMQAATNALLLPHGAEAALGLPSGVPVDATIAFAFLGGTAVMLWRLAAAGRLVGESTGERPRDRGLSGARIAVPYALITFVLGWTVSAVVRFPETAPVAVHPSHAASLLWPFALAAVAGFIGGVRSGPEGAWGSEWWEADEWARRWRAATAGAVRALLVGMAVSLVGFVAVAAVRPDVSVQFVGDGLSGGPVAGLGVAILAVLALPNLALWIMAPAFGACVQISSGFGFTSGPYCFLDYGHAPSHTLAARDYYWGLPKLGPPPASFRLFLLVPLAAALVGVLHGLRLGRVRTRREGALIGALTGVVFIVVFLVALLLSTVTVRLGGPIASANTGYFRYGPQPFDAVELGTAWVVIGGVLLGWLTGRRAERAPATTQSAQGP